MENTPKNTVSRRVNCILSALKKKKDVLCPYCKGSPEDKRPSQTHAFFPRIKGEGNRSGEGKKREEAAKREGFRIGATLKRKERL